MSDHDHDDPSFKERVEERLKELRSRLDPDWDRFIDKHFGPLRVGDLATARGAGNSKTGIIIAADHDAVEICIMGRGEKRIDDIKCHGERCTREHVRVARSEAVRARIFFENRGLPLSRVK